MRNAPESTPPRAGRPADDPAEDLQVAAVPPLAELLAGCAYDPATGAVRLPLVGGRFALVDADVALRVARSTWRIDSRGYPYARLGRSGRRYLHRLVLPCPPGAMADHVNGDRLDARRANLRLADDASNQWNRRTVAGGVGYKGVCVHGDTGRYQGQIRWFGRTYFLGLYADPRAAAVAYWLAARALFGDFAWTNLPEADRRLPDGPVGTLVARRVARAVAKALRDDALRRRTHDHAPYRLAATAGLAPAA